MKNTIVLVLFFLGSALLPTWLHGVPSFCIPLKYFQRIVTEDMIQALEYNTNQYSFKKITASINSNIEEEQMIGMYLKMGLGVCKYCEADTRYSPVSYVTNACIEKYVSPRQK